MPVPAGKEDFLMGLDMLGTHNPAMLFVAALLNVKPIDLKDISEEQALTVTSFFGNARAIVLQVLILIEIMRVNEIEKLKVPVFERRLLGALNLSDAKLILPVLYEGMALLPVINDSLLHYLASYFEALQDPTLEKVGNWNSFEPGIFLDKSLPPEIKVSASQCLQTQRGSISERMRRVQENLQRIRVK
ncbi:hypothetical protein KKH43_04435 [Patescibacteria group bacterium]|nr:hypothetical protein [Patescibacteria group bacterium]